MLKKPQELETNPIYQRLTRDSGWPDDKAARWLIAGVVTGGLLYALAALLIPDPGLVWSVFLFGGASLLITPAVSALAAVSVVIRDLQKEDFQMVRLTLATDKSFLYGYTYATLHRLRVLSVSTRSLIPALIVLGLLTEFQISPERLSIVPTVIIVLVGSLVLVIATRQINEIGAALGVTLALWWQRPIPAAIGASMVMLIVAPVLIGVFGCILLLILTFAVI